MMSAAPRRPFDWFWNWVDHHPVSFVVVFAVIVVALTIVGLAALVKATP